jgi:hypothetical protein
MGKKSLVTEVALFIRDSMNHGSPASYVSTSDSLDAVSIDGQFDLLALARHVLKMLHENQNVG